MSTIGSYHEKHAETLKKCLNAIEKEITDATSLQDAEVNKVNNAGEAHYIARRMFRHAQRLSRLAETLTVISAHQMSMSQLELTGESQENIDAIDSKYYWELGKIEPLLFDYDAHASRIQIDMLIKLSDADAVKIFDTPRHLVSVTFRKTNSGLLCVDFKCGDSEVITAHSALGMDSLTREIVANAALNHLQGLGWTVTPVDNTGTYRLNATIEVAVKPAL
jgi:hypothetical protein